MKRRIGTLLCLSGIILMIQPDINSEEMSMVVNYALLHYWPLLLVVVGALMMNPKQKRRNRN